jgi:hypothetical protein
MKIMLPRQPEAAAARALFPPSAEDVADEALVGLQFLPDWEMEVIHMTITNLKARVVTHRNVNRYDRLEFVDEPLTARQSLHLSAFGSDLHEVTLADTASQTNRRHRPDSLACENAGQIADMTTDFYDRNPRTESLK